VLACNAPPSYVTDSNDCDDLNPSSYPGAAEVCDEVDNNCDEAIDEGDAAPSTWYLDADADGFGNLNSSVVACAAPAGHLSSFSDCDDLNSAIHPGATEVCDEVDNDCDGATDDGAAAPGLWFLDADGDGFGSPDTSTTACIAPFGGVSDSSDCDDLDATAYPGGTEVCDGVDNNCDTQVDEGSAAPGTFYVDADGDTYGNPGVSTTSCSQPLGYTADSSDCNDLSTASYPGATEVCDGDDNNCDDAVDEGVSSTFYTDADSDGYGNPTSPVQACALPPGASTTNLDCNDADQQVNPGGTEVCDGQDNDCSGAIDDGAADATVWYIDADSDGYGDTGSSLSACTQPTGYLATAGDCNDSVSGGSAINPGVAESCDGIDNNCSGTIDDGAAAGSGPACAFNDCTAVRTSNPSAGNGSYFVDPDGSGGYEAFCDFTSSSTPWTWHTAAEAIAYWSFDGSDVTASDVGGYSGSLHGSTNPSSTVPASGFGNSLQSDNSDSGYLQLNSSVPIGSSWSIVFWGQNDNCSNNQIAILYEDNGTYLGDLYHVASYIRANHGTVFSQNAGCGAANTWRHFAYVDTGSQLRVWVDGSELLSPSSYNYANSAGQRINRFMNRPGFGTNGLGGYMDELGVYDIALTGAEIQRIYSETGNSRPLRWQ